MRSREIPGQITKTPFFFGLTLGELTLLFGSPSILLLPALFIKQIPLIPSMVVVLLTFPFIVYIIIRAPEGQSPISWTGAWLSRKVRPETYYLKPSEAPRADSKYLDVIHTVEQNPDGNVTESIASDNSHTETKDI